MRAAPPLHRRDRVTPWAVATLAGLGLIYAAYPTWDYYFDGLVFAGAVESVAAGAPAARLFHPHHLLYSPAAFLGYKALWLGGVRIRAWMFLQLASTACGVATLWIFRRLALRLGSPAALADAGMALLGVGYIFWNFSTQGDTTLPLTLAVLALFAGVRQAAESPGGPTPAVAARMGLLTGAAALLHECAVLIMPAALWMLGRTATRRHRWRVLAGYPAAAGLVIVAGYAGAGRWGLGFRQPAELLAWAHGYFRVEPLTGYAPVYGRWAAGNVMESLKAFGEAFVGPAAEGGPLRSTLAALVAGLLAVAAAARLARARQTPARRAVLTGLAIWLLTHAVFFTWWMPGHTRFWALALPAWVLVLTLGAAAGSGTSGSRWVPGAWLAAAALALLVGTGPFRRESDPAINRWLPIADRLAQATPTDSVVILSGVGPYTSLKIYVPYFATRHMLVLDWQFADPAVAPDTAAGRLRERLVAIARTKPVYVLSEALDPALDATFAANHGVTPSARRRIFAPFHPHRVADLAPGLLLLKL
jgi:hypothetical protein